MCVFSYDRISRFCSYDLDRDLELDPMTLIYKCDLDTLKIYPQTKMKFLGEGFQKLQHKQHRQTHIQMRLNALPSTFVGGDDVNNYINVGHTHQNVTCNIKKNKKTVSSYRIGEQDNMHNTKKA